jgi:hypothetical protein
VRLLAAGQLGEEAERGLVGDRIEVLEVHAHRSHDGRLRLAVGDLHVRAGRVRRGHAVEQLRELR